MKKVIFIGATLLALTTTAIVANNKMSNCEGNKCGKELCCKVESCPLCSGCDDSCCKQ